MIEVARRSRASLLSISCAKAAQLGALIDETENDVLAFMTFPQTHLTQSCPRERFNVEINRRTIVVGIFPPAPPSRGWVVVMMREQDDDWSLNRRYMRLESLQTLAILCRLGCPLWLAK